MPTTKQTKVMQIAAFPTLASTHLVGISGKRPSCMFGVDLSNEYSWLTRLASHAVTSLVSEWLACFFVASHQVNWVQECGNLGNEANGTASVVEVGKVGVRLSCTVNFSNLLDLESFHELCPNLRSETISEHEANFVLSLFRL